MELSSLNRKLVEYEYRTNFTTSDLISLFLKMELVEFSNRFFILDIHTFSESHPKHTRVNLWKKVVFIKCLIT